MMMLAVFAALVALVSVPSLGSLIVGTIISLINQGDVLMAGLHPTFSAHLRPVWWSYLWACALPLSVLEMRWCLTEVSIDMSASPFFWTESDQREVIAESPLVQAGRFPNDETVFATVNIVWRRSPTQAL
jgi:hypothetical protein